MRKHNIAHFMSADGEIFTPVRQQWLDEVYIEINLLKNKNPGIRFFVKTEIDHGHSVYTLFVRPNHTNKLLTINVTNMLTSSKSHMLNKGVHWVSIPNYRDGLEKFNWLPIERSFPARWTEGVMQITISTRNVKIPPKGDRLTIIYEALDSAVWVYKDIYKTYNHRRKHYF